MKIIKYLKNCLFLSIIFIANSCHTKYRLWVGPKKEQKIYNLKYGENKNNVMDVYLPANFDSDKPVILIVHGGGWKIGKKEQIVQIQNFLFRNDYATANINYRLVSRKKGITYKNQLEDIDASLNKLKEIMARTPQNPQKYILLGESSGAHISLLYAYQNSDKIHKVISLSAPTDFYSPQFLKSFYSKYASPTFADAVGEKFDRKNLSQKFREASPVYNVKNVPTLIFQGRKDILVNYRQGKELDSVLTAKKIPHRFVDLGNVGHVSRLFRKKVRDSVIYPEILKFIDER